MFRSIRLYVGNIKHRYKSMENCMLIIILYSRVLDRKEGKMIFYGLKNTGFLYVR